MARVLVTGARAKTGAPLVDRLSRRDDVDLRAGSSDPTRLGLADDSGVRFSWDDAGSWAPATDGVDSLFLVRPDREEAPDLVSGLLATTPKWAHVVLVSEADGGYFDDGAWARRVENAVTRSDHSWTLLRPGWFMQVLTDPRFFLGDIVNHGRLPFVTEGQPVAWVDTRDIAAVAERALLEPVHHGQVYELSGPEALSLTQTAHLLTGAARRPVRHIELTMEDALAGAEGFARDNDFGAFDRVRKGISATITDTVERITGSPATSLRDFLDDHSALVACPEATDTP